MSLLLDLEGARALVRGQVFARPLPWIIVANPTDHRGKSLALSPRGRTLLR
jgi:hypothetical protein